MVPQPPLTHTLATLRDHLSRIERPDSAALAAALSAPVTFDGVRGFVSFEDESYVRSLVYRDDRMELRLHCWRPTQSSSLHGHGASACAFKILRGTATETVLGERDRIWAPGSIVEETAPRLHQVMNAGRDPLLTLHAYSPPLPVDAPSSRRGRQVVIVGGGFAGAAVAYHLLREMDADGRIDLVEMGPWLGRGVAYGVESEVFRLNVQASRMSIDPESPDDFVQFSASEAAPQAFLGRALYGRYVTARLGTGVRNSPARLRIWRDEAVAVTRDAATLRSGSTLPADAIVPGDCDRPACQTRPPAPTPRRRVGRVRAGDPSQAGASVARLGPERWMCPMKIGPVRAPCSPPPRTRLRLRPGKARRRS